MVPGLFSLSVNVLPTWCRKGIGSELLRRSEAFALSNGATKVTAFVPDEYPSGRPFTESHGYRETRRLFESVLSVASVDDSETERTVARAIADGLTFQTLADLGDTEAERRRLHAVTVECDLDEPATAEYGGLEWGDYCRSVFEAEWYRPEGVFVAKRGDEWAGVHVIGPMTGSPVADMTTDFTGVRRPFRGKGLATVLKRLGVRYALHTGGTRILTHNDSTNVPMLAVNQKLGFVARSGLLFMTKEFEV